MATTIRAITPEGWLMGRGYQHATVAEGAKRLVQIAGQVEGSGGMPAAEFSQEIVAQFQGALANFKTVLEAAGGVGGGSDVDDDLPRRTWRRTAAICRGSGALGSRFGGRCSRR